MEATFFRRSFETLIVEKFTSGVLGLGDAVGYQNNTIAGVQAVVVALVARIRQQTHRQIAVGRAEDFVLANQQRRHVPAVDVFELTVAPQAGDDQGRILFADTFAREKAIGGSYDFR